MAEKLTAQEFKSNLSEGLKYPWNKASRLWNILWILIPILGYFALIGYVKNIVIQLIKGNKKQLPAFGGFWDNFKEGIVVIVFLIPTLIALIVLQAIPVIGTILYSLVYIFLVPWLVMNFFTKETFNSLWEVKKAYKIVSENVVEYLYAFLKTLVYVFIYGILSLLLVGIPAYMFGSFYFLADFYRKHK